MDTTTPNNPDLTDDDGAERAAVPAAADALAPSARSVVDKIRKAHEQRDPTLDLSIPEWDGNVVVRFRRLPKSALTAAGRAKKAEASNARVLAAACQEVFIRDPDTGTLTPAREADGVEGAIRFDGRLADMFQLHGETPLEIARAMYADDVALGAHAKRLIDWQTGANLDELPDEDLDELASGEVSAAT